MSGAGSSRLLLLRFIGDGRRLGEEDVVGDAGSGEESGDYEYPDAPLFPMFALGGVGGFLVQKHTHTRAATRHSLPRGPRRC